MVVAPPGVGKSVYLVNQGVKCLTESRKVLHVTCEMSEDRTASRYDSVITLVSQGELRSVLQRKTVEERLDLFQKSFPGSRLIIKEFPTGTVNTNSIRSLLAQLKLHEDFVPDVIIVDYLELLLPIRATDSDYIGQQRIAEELRALAIEEDVPSNPQ